MEKGRKKRIGLAAIMLTAVLSCFAVGATTARYFTETKGTGSVSIAKFDVVTTVTTTGTDEAPPSFDLSEGGVPEAYAFTVENNSDVSVSYDVKVVLPHVTTTDISFILDGDNTKTPVVNGSEYIFEDVGTLESGSNAPHTLVVSVTNFNEDVTIDGITVSVVAEQIALA